jgi:hypothetical protein
MPDEFYTVADVVCLVIFGGSEDHKDAVGREVVHLVPKAWADKQALGVGIEYDALFAAAVEETHAYGASHADTELVELLVCVEAATDARLGTMNPIDPTDYERQCPAKFGDGEPAASIAVLRDWHQLDKGRGHQRVEPTRALRYSP